MLFHCDCLPLSLLPNPVVEACPFLSLSLFLSSTFLLSASTSTWPADSEFTSKMKHRAQTATPGSNITKSSSVGGDMCSLGRNDDEDDDKKRRSSFGAKMAAMVGLGKKSQSTSQLDPEGEWAVLFTFKRIHGFPSVCNFRSLNYKWPQLYHS